MRNLCFVLLFGLAACAGSPVYDSVGRESQSTTNIPGAEDSTPKSGSAEAVNELVQSSRSSRASGDYAHALANIERAIRIEPRNPYLWLELGEIHLGQNDLRQAAAMARKAISVSGEDYAAKDAAERLLDKASAP